MSAMHDQWVMTFETLPADAPPPIVEARFRNVLLHEVSDVEEWAKRVSAELARFKGKVDLLIDLADLHVQPSTSRAFGAARAQVLATYSRYSVRYNADRWTEMSVNTSRVIHGAEANLLANREAALAALLEIRAKGQ